MSKQHLAWFIAGTDTEIGKTFSTCALLELMKNRGLKAVGMKPIAAGTDGEGKNDDVEKIIATSSVKAPLELINPYLFQPAIAPHIAAEEAGISIDLAHIHTCFDALRQLSEAILVEGVGGFNVPLGKSIDASMLATELKLPVILIVGMRLGCINHALLTQEAIKQRGLKLAGWIANTIDPAMSRFEQNLKALKERMHAPLLGVIPASTTPANAAHVLQLPSDAGEH